MPRRHSKAWNRSFGVVTGGRHKRGAHAVSKGYRHKHERALQELHEREEGHPTRDADSEL